MNNAILVLNAGSSSIKFSLFSAEKLNLINRGEIEEILVKPIFTIYDEKDSLILKKELPKTGYQLALKTLYEWLENHSDQITLKAIGHRVVHGGNEFSQPTRITPEVIKKLTTLIPLAPLHQPYELEAIKIIAKLSPKLLQVACFDTAFHRTLGRLATLFAIPSSLTEEGIIRYGFHGLSYEYIASVLPMHIKQKVNGRVIMAHLGQGASMCAMVQRKSVATSMGFTALDGLMMGSRCGNIDPGVILYLLQEKKFSPEKIEKLLYKECGLLGVSGISGDVRELTKSKAPKAKEALDLFCYRAAREFGSLCIALQGCEVLVFTAGIGENSALVRNQICEHLHWFGIALDSDANKRNSTIISTKASSVLVLVIPTNEELMIAKHTRSLF